MPFSTPPCTSAHQSTSIRPPRPTVLTKRDAACSNTIKSLERLRGRALSLSNLPMPWFGIDIGGTLTKLVYFEPTDDDVENYGLDNDVVAVIHRYLVGNTAYGETGVRDSHLQIDNIRMNCRTGTLHFIRFPTCKMNVFIAIAKAKGFASTLSTVCATGGGAYKYQPTLLRELDLELYKFDELESLVGGVTFLTENYRHECYYFDSPLDDSRCVKRPYVICEQCATRDGSPCEGPHLPYPYLVVNVGSGVSMMAVRSQYEYERVTGTSLGGGTFHGLCCLLTGCRTFEEALELAASGDNSNVDKLVRDIYGGDYQTFGLTGDLVASSFGQMIHDDRRAATSRADLARGALVTITNNIGSIAHLAARSENIQRIVFVGNFLRVNQIAMRLLAHAMQYWSQSRIRALFLEHEGYFGAVGCLQELMVASEAHRRNKLAELEFDEDASYATIDSPETSTGDVTEKPDP